MFSVAYYSANQLFADLATTDLQNRLPVVLKRLLKVDLLIVDVGG
jgi:DNA replication protein DnaC